MRALRGLLAALVLALCLGLPAAAMAQSAGDDQYADPFEQKQSNASPAPTAPSSQDSPSSVATSPATDTAAAAGDTGSQKLPYTGLNLVLLLVTGAVLLLSGFTVRRVLTGPYTAAR